jgi:hypothetical protein
MFLPVHITPYKWLRGFILSFFKLTWLTLAVASMERRKVRPIGSTRFPEI